jgi:hypothetical protein
MTTTQYFILLGTIWIAPHAPGIYALIVGIGFIFAGALQ